MLRWNIPNKPIEKNKGAEIEADLIDGVMFFPSRPPDKMSCAICGRCRGAVGWLRLAMSDSEEE